MVTVAALVIAHRLGRAHCLRTCLVIGTETAASLVALGLLIVQATGTANMSAGATAERWTAAELRKPGSICLRIVNHFALED
jgi:hypothetical protein